MLKIILCRLKHLLPGYVYICNLYFKGDWLTYRCQTCGYVKKVMRS